MSFASKYLPSWKRCSESVVSCSTTQRAASQRPEREMISNMMRLKK